MTTTLTIEREVHFQAQARGRKRLRAGPAPQGPLPDPGRVPRVSRLMALALRFEGLLKAEFYKRVGDEAEVRVEYVDNIARTVTGKLRLVVSDIKDGQIVTDS